MPRGAVFVHEGAVPEVKPGKREWKEGKKKKRRKGMERKDVGRE